MGMNGETAVLLDALELLGTTWENDYRPEDIRLSERAVKFLLSVKKLVDDPGGLVTAALVRAKAPTFADQYQQVLMREL